MTDDSDAHVAIIDTTPRKDGTVLIRGMGLLAVLKQFTAWVVPDHLGVLIPPNKVKIARAALEAAGWRVVTGHEPDSSPTAQRRMPLPLPECSHCHAPYMRTYRGRYCKQCGHVLELVQIDPNEDVLGVKGACAVCGAEVDLGDKFCPNGHEVAVQLELDEADTRPWRERYAELLADFTGSFGRMPADIVGDSGDIFTRTLRMCPAPDCGAHIGRGEAACRYGHRLADFLVPDHDARDVDDD
jgi:hypothetical protein